MSHIPVLKNEIIKTFEYLQKEEGFFVDGTLGMAGHSLAIAEELTNNKIKIIGIDKDFEAIKIASDNIKNAKLQDKFVLVHDDFKNIIAIINEQNIDKIAGALIDLGVSSLQLDDKGRGFSFEDKEAFLDMRMNSEQKLDAQEILNKYSESELARILFLYGEEKFSRVIARNVCKSRKDHPVHSVKDLLSILEDSIPLPVRLKSKKHYATNVFRALRIEVNDELKPLGKALQDFINCLSSGARLAVITFHSTEDRIVKQLFRDKARECSCPMDAPVCTCDQIPEVLMITKKPIVPSDEEIAINPRSRSSKLRVIEKV